MAKSRRQRRSLVGVEIYETEVRIVETRFTSGKPVVSAAGAAHLPEKCIVDGEIVRVDAVAFATRKLLETLQIESRDAIIGIPFAGFTTRSLKLPPTPPDELAILIEGEVRHFDILRSPDGAYDYFKIATQDPLEVGLVLMASEGHVTASLRAVADRSGLNVVALEPISIGMLRTACVSPDGVPEGLLLLVGETATEAAVMHDGRNWLYRRIDIGTNALMQAGSSEMERIDPFNAPVSEQEPSPEVAPVLRKGPADSFAVEIRRTLEYFAREFPDATTKTVIRMAVCDPLALPIQEFLETALKCEVRLVAPSGFVSSGDKVLEALGNERAFRFGGAYGLALHQERAISEAIPALDLFVRERRQAQLESKRRTFAGSLVTSILAVIVGIAGTLWFGSQANRAEEELGQLNTELQQLRGSERQNIIGSQRALEQIAYFSRQGVPAVWIVDSLASHLNPEVGVDEVRFEDGGTILITGEAASEQALLLTVQNMQSQPNIGMAYVSSFERIDQNSSSLAIRFQLRLVRAASSSTAAGGANP